METHHPKPNHEDLKLPNVHRAFSPWSEDQKLYVAAMYSNPPRWKSRRYLFHETRKRMEASPNVEFYCCEVAFGDRAFEVTSRDNPRDIQLRTQDETWLKERALNLAVQRFPESAQYFAYIDGDIQMSRHDWAVETVHLLQHYDAVQLFSQFTDMDAKHRPLNVTKGFAYAYSQIIVPEIYQEERTKRKASGAAGASENCYQSGLDSGHGPGSTWWGATGLAWAFRKSAWNTFGGLLDTCILGSADWHMAYGLANIADHRSAGDDAYHRAIKIWQEHASALKGNIWFLDNHINHYFHGPKVNRFYRERNQILTDNRFNPYEDLKADWQGLWQLSGNKPKLRDDLRAYFRARSEDATELAPGQTLLVR